MINIDNCNPDDLSQLLEDVSRDPNSLIVIKDNTFGVQSVADPLYDNFHEATLEEVSTICQKIMQKHLALDVVQRADSPVSQMPAHTWKNTVEGIIKSLSYLCERALNPLLLNEEDFTKVKDAEKGVRARLLNLGNRLVKKVTREETAEQKEKRLAAEVGLTLHLIKEWKEQVEETAPKKLSQAVKEGDQSKVERLIHLGADMNKMNDEGLYPIQIAILSGKKEIINDLLAGGVDVHLRDHQDNTLLHYAVRSGSAEVVELMLSKDGHLRGLEASNKKGLTPFLFAAVAGNEEVVKALYSRATEADKEKAFLLAIEHKNNEAIEVFLEKGASQEVKDEGFLLAAKLGDLKRIDQLMRHGVNEKAKDPDGNTPLMLATKYGHVHVVKKLLRDNFDPAVINPLLRLTAAEGHISVIRHLLHLGANTLDLNPRGENVFMVAAKAGQNGIIQFLLSHKEAKAVSMNHREKAKLLKSMLEEAMSGMHLQTVEMLLKEGADVHASYGTKIFSALYFAIDQVALAIDQKKDQKQIDEAQAIVKSLLSQKYSAIEIRLALMRAASSGNVEIVRLILRKNVDEMSVNHAYLSAGDPNNNSKNVLLIKQLLWNKFKAPPKNLLDKNLGPPLRLAIESGDVDNVKALLNEQANVDETWTEWKNDDEIPVTMFDLANEKGNAGIINLLRPLLG